MHRGPADARIVLLGNALVLALVVALPLCLALLPVETLQRELGTGDLSAAALSSLDRDIQTQRALATQGVSVPPTAFLALHASAGEPHAASVPVRTDEHEVPRVPGCCTAGPTDAGHCLLL